MLTLREQFSNNLRILVEKSGQSQRTIAAYIDVSSSTVNDWIQGKKIPRIDKLERLAEYFNVDACDLIGSRKLQRTGDEFSLLIYFRSLDPDDKVTLLEYAEFLASKTQKKKTVSTDIAI